MQEMDKYIELIWETVTFEFAFKFFVVYFFLIWLSLILWVIKDISIRTKSWIFRFFCVLTVIFLTPLGLFVYLLIRPGKTLFEKYYREIEYNLDIVNQIVEERKKNLEENYSKKGITVEDELPEIPENKKSKKSKKSKKFKKSKKQKINNPKNVYKYSFVIENKTPNSNFVNKKIQSTQNDDLEIINLDDLNTKKELL